MCHDPDCLLPDRPLWSPRRLIYGLRWYLWWTIWYSDEMRYPSLAWHLRFYGRRHARDQWKARLTTGYTPGVQGTSQVESECSQKEEKYMSTLPSVTGNTPHDNPLEHWTWFPLVTRVRAQRLSDDLDTALQHIVEMREERAALLAELVHVRDERTQLQRDLTSLRKEFAEYSEAVAKTEHDVAHEHNALLKAQDEITRLKAELARLNPPRKRQGRSAPVAESEAQV